MRRGIKHYVGIFILLSGIFPSLLQAKIQSRGVGLASYISYTAEKKLAALLLANREKLAPYLAIENYQDSALTEVSCKFQIWKPFKIPERNEENRIECEIRYANYKKSRMFFMLSDDLISSPGIDVDPSIRFTGPSAELLAKVFAATAHDKKARKDFSILSAKYFDREQVHYIESKHEELPVIICSDAKDWCELRWPKVAAATERVSLGENSKVFAQALCGWNAGVDGECPKFWDDASNFHCDFVGLWVPFSVWGAIDTSPGLECTFTEADQKQKFRLELGPVVTSPWGNRFGDTHGISMRGIWLTNLYRALHGYAEDHAKEEGNPITTLSLPGRAGFAMESVSLRRSAEPSEGVVSLDCSDNDVSVGTFYREPVAELRSLSEHRYECIIQTAPALKFK